MPIAMALTVLMAVTVAGGAAGAALGSDAKTPCRTVYVVDNGWHTGIIVAAADFRPRRFLGADYFRGKTWLEFGWGDAGFYQAKEITAGLAMQALFWPTDSVMHLFGFNGMPERVFRRNELITLRLPETGYQRLLRGLKEGFATDAAGKVQPMKPGLYGRSHFYKGTGSYSILRTSNTWNAEVLLAAGVAVEPEEAARASDLMGQLQESPANECGAPKLQSPP